MPKNRSPTGRLDQRKPHVEDDQRRLDAVQDRLKLSLTSFIRRSAPDSFVDGHQFFVGGLQFLVRGLQFFVDGLQLFVVGLHFLVGRFQALRWPPPSALPSGAGRAGHGQLVLQLLDADWLVASIRSRSSDPASSMMWLKVTRNRSSRRSSCLSRNISIAPAGRYCRPACAPIGDHNLLIVDLWQSRCAWLRMVERAAAQRARFKRKLDDNTAAVQIEMFLLKHDDCARICFLSPSTTSMDDAGSDERDLIDATANPRPAIARRVDLTARPAPDGRALGGGQTKS
jgi:hypothetical protein